MTENKTFEKIQREVVRNTSKIIETMNTEGWVLIEKIFRDQIERLYKKLRNCKEEELKGIQGILIALETILNTLNFAKQENKVAERELKKIEEGGE